MALVEQIRRLHKHNVDTLRRQPVAEISGALGDLGTLLPLMIALALQGSIDLSTTLVFSGLFNVATGVLFGIPLPVQPMKAIAAAAIASHSSLEETVAAGGWVGAAVLVLSITGLLRWLARVVPVPVVKGIQLGAGLSLVISAGTAQLRPLGWVAPPLDNRLWALLAFVALLLTQHRFYHQQPRGSTSSRPTAVVPYALAVFLLGLLMALLVILIPSDSNQHPPRLPHFAIWHPSVLLPAWLAPDAIGMALAQLPLTTLNSIIAAAALATDLMASELPASGMSTTTTTTPATATSLGFSVAAMNLLGCWFGAMPVCHGAGGLAAQHRFGARSGASVILLGLAKTGLGLALGTSLLDLLRAFPRSLLGVMVLAAGLELARVGASLNHGASDLWEASVAAAADADGGSDSSGVGGTGGGGEGEVFVKRHREVSEAERAERWTVMMTTTAGILAFKNDAVGFAAGLLCHGAYRLVDYLESRRARRGVSGEGRPLLG